MPKLVRHTTATLLMMTMVALSASVATAHEAPTRKEQDRHIAARARSVIGTSYSYGGASPGGFDCSGFTRWVFRGHGADLPHSSQAQFDLGERHGYQRIWDRRNLEVGDLVFHKTTSARVGHVGVYIGRGRFISSTSSEGVQVRSLHDPYYWGPRWVGATRLPVMIDAAGRRNGRNETTSRLWI